VLLAKRSDPFFEDSSRLFTVPIDGGPATQISSLIPGSIPRFVTTASGNQAAILYGRSDPEMTPDLHLVSLNGESSLQLNLRHDPGEHFQFRTMTSDGRYAFYTISSSTVDSVGLYRTSLEDGSVLKLSDDLPIGSFVSGVVLSPDDTQLLYKAAIGDGEYNNLFSVSIDGTNHRQIIPQPESGPLIEEYYFSADSKNVAYQLSPEVGGDELFLMPLSGGPSVRISPIAETEGFGVEYFRVVGNWAVYTYGESLNERYLYAVQIPEPASASVSFSALLAFSLLRRRSSRAI
jgi:hypothetical protein